MSDAEKLVEAGLKYPDDPLILRPQVGGDILRARGGGRLCWPRSIILRLMLIFVLFATIAGCILIIFTLYHSGAWPWNRFHGRYSSASGSCRVFTSFPEVGIEERYLYEPNAITITHGPVAGFPSVATFHLLKEALSVMHTHGTCYVYPLDPEIAEAVPVDDSVIEHIKESRNPSMSQIKSPFGIRVFMISSDSNDKVKIEHPAAAANCSNVPIFRLIEMVLSQASAGFDPFQSLGADAFPPVSCPSECTWGESREDSMRKVCRCPPRDTPPAIPLPQFPEPNEVAQEETKEDANDKEDEAEFYDPSSLQSINDQLFPGNQNQEAVALPVNNKPAYPVVVDSTKNGIDTPSMIEEDEEEEEIDNDDQYDVDDEIPTEFEERFGDAEPWLPDGETLSRRQRSIDALHLMEGPVKIPSGCVQVDDILGTAVPNSQKHTLSKMTILRC